MIRKATAADFDFIFELYMHPLINPWLLYEPMEQQRFQPIFEELLNKKVLFVFEADGTGAGMCKLVPFEHRTSHILYVGGIAVHPSFAGKGYGLLLMEEIKTKAAAEGFKRLELSVATVNDKAIRMYERCGFVKEGVLRNYTFLKAENRYLDEQVMSCLI
ncbi:MAG: GNAT family N-acetyltransferase [Chitinophagaceae bacterium]|nr:GNAT family N-acetyltransferase [Chitinophagaceae bacterium]